MAGGDALHLQRDAHPEAEGVADVVVAARAAQPRRGLVHEGRRPLAPAGDRLAPSTSRPSRPPPVRSVVSRRPEEVDSTANRADLVTRVTPRRRNHPTAARSASTSASASPVWRAGSRISAQASSGTRAASASARLPSPRGDRLHRLGHQRLRLRARHALGQREDRRLGEHQPAVGGEGGGDALRVRRERLRQRQRVPRGRAGGGAHRREREPLEPEGGAVALLGVQHGLVQLADAAGVEARERHQRLGDDRVRLVRHGR